MWAVMMETKPRTGEVELGDRGGWGCHKVEIGNAPSPASGL